MKKPHNKTNLYLGLAAFAGAAGYAFLKKIGLPVVGGFFAAWAAAEIFLNLSAEPQSGKGDADDLREKNAVEAANKVMAGMGVHFRGSGLTMSPTGNVQLDDHKKLLPITWTIILALYWWMPILAVELSGVPGPIALFPEPLMLLPPVVLAAVDFWMLKRR